MSFTRVFYHLVWATHKRKPFLADGVIRQRTYSVIVRKATALGGIIHAIGGVADHVHVVATIPTTLALSEFVRQNKRVSSHFVSQAWPNSLQSFQWQGGYGAFTLSESHLNRIVSYVQHQEMHHAPSDRNLQSRLEQIE
jgi:putative transposase